MTKHQAEAIFRLTSHPSWAVFIHLQEERLKQHHENLEWEEKNVKGIQGAIAEIRYIIKLEEDAELVLSK